MRFLREYERLAQQTHHCDRCHRHIEPGEFYQGSVYVSESRKNYRITILKYHASPPCPEDPFEEEIREEMERDRREERLRERKKSLRITKGSKTTAA